MTVRECIAYLHNYLNEGGSANDEFTLMATAVYDKLQERLTKLRKLETAGVDNWCGYSDALNRDEEEGD